jgi:hypothetical protein
MLGLLIRMMDGLIVYPENMARNLELSLGLWNSQTILLALIRKGLTREQAYDLVQRNAMKTWQAKHAGHADANFKVQLAADPEVVQLLPPDELDRSAHSNSTSNTSKTASANWACAEVAGPRDPSRHPRTFHGFSLKARQLLTVGRRYPNLVMVPHSAKSRRPFNPRSPPPYTPRHGQ